MKKISLALLISCTSILFVKAQSKKKQDIQAIKSMCGCYEVTFNFAETINYVEDENYQPSKTKTDKGLEWVQLVEEDKNKVSMQHLLIVGPKEKPYIVKHWRQDWLYQNTSLYEYDHNNKWIYKNLPKKDVKKQWTQKVFQVDDSPRYEGTASWIHVDGKSYWENTTSAPLPRREYTKSADYNVTLRGNRHEITKNGWIHDQNNSKILREVGKEDIVIAKEKGYNTYVKVNDFKCKAAQDWWGDNQEKWETVRNEWNTIFARNKNLELHQKVNNKLLYKYLFNNKDYNNQEQISNIIQQFIK